MTDTLTHAITVPQPLAWAVAAGHCPVLISDTRPALARIEELIGIHASRRVSWELPGPGPHPSLAGASTSGYGILLGVARLVGVVFRPRHAVDRASTREFEIVHGRGFGSLLADETASRIRPWWRSGSKWGLLLTDAVLLPEPIPMRGAGGVWQLKVPGDDGVETWAPDFSEWALEQWRKARGA